MYVKIHIRISTKFGLDYRLQSSPISLMLQHNFVCSRRFDFADPTVKLLNFKNFAETVM